MSIQETLSQIEALSAQSEKLNGYTNILAELVKENDTAGVSACIDSILNESVGLAISRPALAQLVGLVDKVTSHEARATVVKYALERISPRVTSFEEQDSQLREKLADIYEAENDNEAAASILQSIPLESGQRNISEEFKLNIYVRILRNLLEVGDTVAAETYLHRAQMLIHTTSDKVTQLHFKLAQARILDSKRQFLAAAAKYHELSYVTEIADEERLHCLGASITCAVLAPAGPQRSRILSTLYKDDRSQQISTFSILEKMFLDRLIDPAEVDAFAETLSEHQKALLADGTTVLSRAVLEHNVLAATHLYHTIRISELASLLGVDSAKAEAYCSTMIGQGRLMGMIDQVDGIISFEVSEEAGGPEIRRWDMGIQSLAEAVEGCASELVRVAPEWVAQKVAV
ncbi:hypothetical protein YB2330_003128 [Saitoella coloradoensis]